MQVEFIVLSDFWFYWSYFYVKVNIATIDTNKSENIVDDYIDNWLVDNCFV